MLIKILQLRQIHRHVLRSVCLSALVCLPLLVTVGCTAKAKLERHVKRADAYFAKGQFDEARIEYLNAFRLNQNDPHVAARLGESFLESGDIQRGYQLLAHARELQPTNNAVRVKLASLFLLGGEPKRAREEAEAILKTDPRNSDALVLLANSAANTNEVAATRQRLESLLPSAPQDPAIHLALGVLAQKMGDAKGAEAEFDQAVQFDPKSSKNHYALANICFAQGDTNKAEVHFKAAFEAASPKSIERLGYAEFLQKTGRPAEAKKLLEDTTAKAPDFVAAWNMLTQIAFAQSDTNSAAQYISKALAQSADNRDALLNRARLKLASRDFKTAESDLQQLADNHPRDSQVFHQLAIAQLAGDDSAKALGSLEKSISLNANNLDARLLRAQIQVSRGDLNSAIPELVQITRQAPKAPQPQYLLATAYRQRGSIDDAINVYTNVARLFPSDPQPFQMIGAIRRQQTNLVAARQNYEAALKINPNFLPAIDDLIELDIIAKNYQAALDRVQVYIEKYPDKPMPRLLQAKVLFAENKNSEAEAAVKKAIELDPEFYPAHRALVDFYVRTDQIDSAVQKLEGMVAKNDKDIGSLLQLGMLYESRDDYKKARQAYENLLKINPASVPALNNLGYMLSEHFNDPDAAFEFARKARDLAPYDPFTADTYGWILFNRGDYSAALAAIQQSIDRLPTQPEVQYHYGMAQYMLGAADAATAALERSLSSTNQFNGRAKAQNALTILKVDPTHASAESLSLLQQTVQKSPSDAFAWTRLAQVQEAHKDWAAARQSYEKALAVNPRSTLILSRLAVLEATQLNNPAKGLELARRAWSISQSSDLAAVIGPIGYLADDYKWAFGVLVESQRSQSTPEASYYYGLTAYALGRLDQASEALTAAAQSSNLPDPAARLAKPAALIASFQLGSAPAAQAQTAIATAQSVDPAFPPAAIATGVLAEQKGDFNSARAQYEQVMNAHLGYLIAQRQLGLLLADKLADDAKATELLTSLRTEFPNDARISAALGKIAYRRADYSEAVRYLRLITSQPGTDPDLLYYLGMSQYHLKDKGAKGTLTRALAEKPNATLTADAKTAIAELNKAPNP